MTNTGSGCRALAFVVGGGKRLRLRKPQKHQPRFRYAVAPPLPNSLASDFAELCYGGITAKPFDESVSVHAESKAYFTLKRKHPYGSDV